jgi:hypothetical protein
LDALEDEELAAATPAWLKETKISGRLQVKYGEKSQEEL